MFRNFPKLLAQLKSFNYLGLAKELIFFVRFFLLVISFLFFGALRWISRLPLLNKVLGPVRKPAGKIYLKVMNLFNSRAEGEISSLDIILLSARHLAVKKSRTIITIGGMAVGFGSVIFLLSLGYGVQQLVVSRVARLDEMKQINVTVGQASSLRINDAAITGFKGFEKVKSVIPMISVVSKVNFNNSASDAVAYGVTREFLEQSAIQPIFGNLFEDTQQTSQIHPPETEAIGQVAGAAKELITGAKLGKQTAQVKYSIYPLVWKPVYAEPSLKSELIGYTSRTAGDQEATEVWGQQYQENSQLTEGTDIFGNIFQPWIKDTVPIWKKTACPEDQIDCVAGEYLVARQGDQQLLVEGYLTQPETKIDRYQIIADSKPTLIEGEQIESIEFSFKPNFWSEVYSDVFNTSVMPYLFSSQLRPTTVYAGDLVFGEKYPNSEGWGSAGKNINNSEVGFWIRAKLPLWRKVDCNGCDNMYLVEKDAAEKQITATAFIKASQVNIENMPQPPQFGQVLGEATESASLAETTSASDSGDLALAAAAQASDSGEITLADGSILSANKQANGLVDWVSIASGSASTGFAKRQTVKLADSAQKVAIVNKAMLKVLSIEPNQAVGQSFSTVFMLDQEFFSKDGYQAESEPAEYKIVGVIPDDKSPAFYLPFNDLKGLGVENYSQVKLIVDNQNDIKQVRQQAEANGYRTASVVDTVSKINELFNTIRAVLSVLGLVALSVAALGMFNTLTVSLLEKTREVGLMKAIGMKSNEVHRLFLAESVVMGLLGGIFGLVLSVIAGQLLSFALSVMSVSKGLGYIQIVYIPIFLSFGVICLAFLIGVLTGLYPSYRATKISALNALRYE